MHHEGHLFKVNEAGPDKMSRALHGGRNQEPRVVWKRNTHFTDDKACSQLRANEIQGGFPLRPLINGMVYPPAKCHVYFLEHFEELNLVKRGTKGKLVGGFGGCVGPGIFEWTAIWTVNLASICEEFRPAPRANVFGKPWNTPKVCG